jgi:hypothetical protein
VAAVRGWLCLTSGDALLGEAALLLMLGVVSHTVTRVPVTPRFVLAKIVIWMSPSLLLPMLGQGSSLLILWFAGASAMAGLLNLIPRYLPRYGMAPGWTRAVRPLVLILTAGAFLITVIFKADVDAQGGAYATGVLVLITSAALAVTLAAHHAGQRRRRVAFGVVTLVFGYTTAANVVERPDGVKIAAIFIGAILLVSLASRVGRAFELRATEVTFDGLATRFVRDCAHRTIRFIANEPDRGDRDEYSEKLRQVTRDNDLPDSDVIFVEITVTDPSDFIGRLEVTGEVRCGRYRVLRLTASSVPNAIAALMLEVRDRTGRQIDSQRDVGGWPELESLPAPRDNDDDGMPDSWERKHGLDPRKPDGDADRNGDGFTNLEEWLAYAAVGRG